MAVGTCTLIDYRLPLDAGSATISSTPWSVAVATEAAGTLAARFLPLPFSSLGMGQPLNKRDFKNLQAGSSNMLWALGAAKNLPMTRAVCCRVWSRAGCDLKPGRRNPHDGLGRGEHAFLAQRHRVQVRGFKRRAHEVLGLFWKGRPRLLEDFGAWGRIKGNNGKASEANTYGHGPQKLSILSTRRNAVWVLRVLTTAARHSRIRDS